MTTCWVIELHPLNGRGKSWFHTGTLRHTRKEAWLAVLGEHQTDMWRNTVEHRRKNGFMRAVRVTIEKVTP